MTQSQFTAKLNKFFSDYLGKTGVGFNIPGQCVAYANQYWLDIWGIRFPLQGAGTALEIFTKATNTRPDLFTKVTNNPNDKNQYPSRGDAIIHSRLAGGLGHIQILDSIVGNTYYTYESNWVANKVTREAHPLQEFGKTGDIIGWIHNTIQPDPVVVDPCADFKKQIADLSIQLSKEKANVTTVTSERDKLQLSLNQANTKIKELEAENAKLKAQVGDSTKWQTLKALIKELIS